MQENTQDSERQTNPDVIGLQDGGFFVGWDSETEPGDCCFGGIFARRYNIVLLSSESTGRDAVVARHLAVDLDGDAVGDAWKRLYGLDDEALQAIYTDSDDDGLTTPGEFGSGSNPLLADTDGDGMSDGYEVEYGLKLLETDGAGDLDVNQAP